MSARKSQPNPTDTPRKFAVFDIDGTLFRSGLYREVTYELIKMNILPEEALSYVYEKRQAYRHRAHAGAFEEFEGSLVELMDSMSTHIRVADYDLAVKRVVEAKLDNVYSYTRDLLKRLKSNGYFLIAVSGSQIELVEPFARKYGFDEWVGQKWERGEEYFTGNIVKTHTGKEKIIAGLIDVHNLTLTGSVGVGDSPGDIGMLDMVDHPIAMNPTHKLLEHAMDHNWEIIIERKNVIYKLSRPAANKPYTLERVRHI